MVPYTVTCRTADATAALQHEIQNGMVTFEADGQEGQPEDRIYVTPIVYVETQHFAGLTSRSRRRSQTTFGHFHCPDP
jgi:hypothetical protein